MRTIDWRLPAGACALLLGSLMLAPQAAAGRAQAKALRPGVPATYPRILYPGACMSYGACGRLWWDESRQWRRPVAPDPPAFLDADIWGTSGSRWGYVRRLPPPTPQSHIQPRYRDASTIRPEFAEPEDKAPR